MEDFYALASVDYRYLAEAHDWRSWLQTRQREAVGRPLRLLDVACGSGKFPVALTRFAGVTPQTVGSVDCALLDPSAFSIAETRRVLPPPFRATDEFECTLQDLDCTSGSYDVLWATHALYAIPEAEIQAALKQFVRAIRPGGWGVIGHACSDAHYLRFYRHFLNAFRDGEGTPYTSAETIGDALAALGARFDIVPLTYSNGAPDSERARVEGYLQRCVFDSTVSLDAMLDKPETGDYLRGCLQDGEWRFEQHVQLIFIRV